MLRLSPYVHTKKVPATYMLLVIYKHNIIQNIHTILRYNMNKKKPNYNNLETQPNQDKIFCVQNNFFFSRFHSLRKEKK